MNTFISKLTGKEYGLSHCGNFVRYAMKTFGFASPEEVYQYEFGPIENKCQECGAPTKFKSFGLGYEKLCHDCRVKRQAWQNYTFKDGYSEFVKEHWQEYIKLFPCVRCIDPFDGSVYEGEKPFRNKILKYYVDKPASDSFWKITTPCDKCGKPHTTNIFDYSPLCFNCQHSRIQTPFELVKDSFFDIFTKEASKWFFEGKEVPVVLKQGKLVCLYSIFVKRYCENCHTSFEEKVSLKIVDNKIIPCEPESRFCSSGCYNKWKVGNWLLTPETRRKQSETMRQKIKEGKFTPPIINSLTRKYITCPEYPNCQFRSTWELFYWYITKLPYEYYEKVRIPYFDSTTGKNKNYILDFVDEENKRLIEIKPEPFCNSQRNKDKFSAAAKWAKENGYSFDIVTDRWFKDKVKELQDIDFMGEYKARFLKGLGFDISLFS